MEKNMKKGSIQAIIIGLVVLCLFNLMAFVIPFDRNATFWIAYAAEMIAILAQFGVFKYSSDREATLKSRVLGFPLIRVGYIYLIVQSILSVLLMILATFIEKMTTWIPIISCAFVLGLAIICFVSVDVVRDQVERLEETSKVDTQFIMLMRAKSMNIAGQPVNPQSRVYLQAVAEKFKYSDPVTSQETMGYESRIGSVFTELESAALQNNDMAIQAISQNLINLIDSRNNICKLTKQR